MIRPLRTKRLIRAAVMMIVLIAFAVTPAFAQNAPDVILPDGLGCAGFDLGISFTGGGAHRAIKEFVGKNGVVRTLDNGKGYDLTFENMTTHEQFSTRANGSNIHTTTYLDKTQSVVILGHTILNLYPTDFPAGPSTTLYIGRVTYTVDADFVYRVQKVSGRSIDICAQLAS